MEVKNCCAHDSTEPPIPSAAALPDRTLHDCDCDCGYRLLDEPREDQRDGPRVADARRIARRCTAAAHRRRERPVSPVDGACRNARHDDRRAERLEVNET